MNRRTKESAGAFRQWLRLAAVLGAASVIGIQGASASSHAKDSHASEHEHHHGDDGHANEHEHHHGKDGHGSEHEHHHGDDGHADEHEHHHGNDGHANEHEHHHMQKDKHHHEE